MLKAKINKKVLFIVFVLLLSAFVSSAAFAGTFVDRYSGTLNYGQYNNYHSDDFYINTGTASISGIQNGVDDGTVAKLDYMIDQSTWYGYNTLTSIKTIDGNSSYGNGFSMSFSNLPQATSLALEVDLNRDVTSSFSGNIYDGQL